MAQDKLREASRRGAARPFGRVEALAQGDIKVDFEKAVPIEIVGETVGEFLNYSG